MSRTFGAPAAFALAAAGGAAFAPAPAAGAVGTGAAGRWKGIATTSAATQ